MPDATIMRENVPIPADTASGVPPIQQEHLALGLARHSFDRAVKRPAMEVAR